jgi:MOSC domain-containing protein YiiM
MTHFCGMKIIHVSVGEPQEVEFEGKRVLTSIFKSPVEGKVEVRLQNIDGDRQSDLTVHGGRNKAIYVYSIDYYEGWSKELGAESLQIAQFGENLTVSGGRDNEVRIGSRYRFGEVEATVTQPRLPCFKLGIRMNDKTFPKTFWDRGRLGFYLRVDKEGSLGQGDSIELIEQPEHDITIRRLFDIAKHGGPDDAVDAMAKLAHLDSGWMRRLRHTARHKARKES